MRGFVGYNIKRAYIRVQGAAQAALAPFELRVLSFTALSIIGTNPGITPSQLAVLLGMERSNVVAVIDDLMSRDLVSRERLETDRRRFALTMTARGGEVQKAAARAIAEFEGRLVSVLSEEEQATLVRLLNRIEAEGAATKD
nr:MarR family transcriptional regulator [Jiella avicenniae]